jgi:anti-sigma B factor antagonist
MSETIIQQTLPLPDGIQVHPVGDIDLSRSPQLRLELLHLAKSNHKRLVIDLAQVPYMDSSGVATLIETLHQVQRKSGGRLILCSLQPKVLSIFEIARLNMVFTIVENAAAARSA